MKSLLALLLFTLAASAAPNPFDQSGVPLEEDTTNAASAKIVLLAGAPSNKPGQHEYFAGGALLMQWLRQNPGVHPVMARDDWPKNERVFEGARAVVYFGDGGAKLPFLEPARRARLAQLLKNGAGFVLLHQAVDVPESHATETRAWLGGVWQKDIGCRGHWDMDLKPAAAAEHPVLHGVKPFAAPADGWLFNLHFEPAGVTPLLVGAVPDKARTTADAKKHAGRDEVMAWAFERPDGGRAFSFTGCDLHRNWAAESQRRLVVNGILWAAKADVPTAGALVELEPGTLEKNLDDKRAFTVPRPSVK